MKSSLLLTLLLSSACFSAFGQPAEAPEKFEAADVHVSAKSQNQIFFFGSNPVRNGRYEIKNSTMVDLIRAAYSYDSDKILGGPNWLEMDRFDVIGKLPEHASADAQKQMLQAVLEDRFKLVLHKDTKPLQAYALIAGKKPQLKEADGTEQTGCRPHSSSSGSSTPPGSPVEGRIQLFMSSSNGTSTTLTLGPGMTVQFECRNMTMEQFAGNLRGMMGSNLGSSAVMDETGLKGKYNFDVRWSMALIGPMGAAGDRITIFDAMEKQLGLKLEERQIPTPVLVVESVNHIPSPNPPGTAEALPPIPVPTEFEVASVKPSDPGGRGGRFNIQPGGRLISEGMMLRFLLSRAFDSNNRDQIQGLPSWVDSERFDITAKAPGGAASVVDYDNIGPLIKALLVERFKMTFHSEDRPVSAYTLVAGKPKMKKADPASRTFCKNPTPPPGTPPGSRILTCQNVTMEQFAERLQNMSPELNWPITDSTELSGGWDFTLTFMPMMGMMNPAMMAARSGGEGGGGAAGGPAMPSASDPIAGYTLFEAIDKQLGLKLSSVKRTLPVIVIDHLEQKPTEN